MRLTLRTLLAYLDGLLDSRDAQLLKEKIQSGRLAQGMIERIHAVTSRPKLTAPKPDARGATVDANTVAQYLDNNLPPDRVADFERDCLDDDARLAEVAACHRILTMVLEKPAIVSNPMRDRIRRLGNHSEREADESETRSSRGPDVFRALKESVGDRNGKRYRIDPTHHEGVSETPSSAADATLPMNTTGLELDDKLIQQVPEYLKSGKTNDWSNATIIGSLIVALIFLTWLSVGSPDQIRMLLDRSLRPTPPVILVDRAEHRVPNQEIEAGHAADRGSAVDTVPQPVRGTQSILVDEPPAPIIVESSPPPSQAVAPPVPPPVPPADLDSSSVPMPNLDAPRADAPRADAPRADAPRADAPRADAPRADAPIAEATRAEAAPSSLRWLPETKESSATPLIACAKTSEGIGYRRLSSGDSLALDEWLVAPPAFRSELRLDPGIRWTIADETVIAPASSDRPDTATVELRLGRGLVEATPDGRRLILRNPIHPITLFFDDLSSMVAIELRYQRTIGASFAPMDERPDASFSRPVLRIACVAGQASLEIEEEEPIHLAVGQALEWTTNTPQKAFSIESAPWWYQASTQRAIDEEARNDLAKKLQTITNPRQIEEGLRAASQHRRVESAALAIRTLLLLGEYDSLFGTSGPLANPSFRPHRIPILDSLYQSLGANPNHLLQLKQSAEISEPDRAPRLLGLLALPDDAQLAEGADRALVEGLSSPFLDERVLCIYQLNAILGKDFGFQSDRPSAESLQHWKKLLNVGKIRWTKSSKS